MSWTNIHTVYTVVAINSYGNNTTDNNGTNLSYLVGKCIISALGFFTLQILYKSIITCKTLIKQPKNLGNEYPWLLYTVYIHQLDLDVNL